MVGPLEEANSFKETETSQGNEDNEDEETGFFSGDLKPQIQEDISQLIMGKNTSTHN